MLNFKRNIPNILTVFRIIIIIPIIILLFIPSILEYKIFEISIDSFLLSTNLSFLITLVLFIIASLTDFLDGYIARKFKFVSDVGKILDPIADKILVNVIMIVLGSYNIIILPIILLFVIRDIIMDAIRIFAISKKIDVSANIWGKLKTFTQMVAIIFVLVISTSSYNWWYFAIQNLLFYFSLFFSFVSLFLFTKKVICYQKNN